MRNTTMRLPKLITPKKFINENCPELARYCGTFTANIHKGFFEFDKCDSELWAGPWGECGVLMLLKEYTNHDILSRNVGHELEGYPTEESPFRIYLSGTDDTSYSKVFTNMEDMLHCACDIVSESSKDKLFELGFEFTN